MTADNIRYCKKLLDKDPYNEEALSNLARYYINNEDERSAIKIFLEYSSPMINAQFSDFIYSLQLKGRYKEAFNLYDKLIHTNGGYNRCPRYFSYLRTLKKFDTDDTNKRLLVCGVDPLGDQIFYSNFFYDLLRITDQITAIVLPRLVEPLSRTFPSIRFLSDDWMIDVSNFDCVALMSLLPMFSLNVNDSFIQTRKPSLRPSHKKHHNFSKDKLTVGLSWSSTRPDDKGSTYIRDHKSINLKDLLPLLKLSNTEFINLQHGEESKDLYVFAKKHSLNNLVTFDELDTTNDIEGVMDIIDACDIVITPSNTLAHFAGAMHKETYTILPHSYLPARLWYWHRSDNKKNIWYPTINTYEQKVKNDWSHPIKELVTDLKKGEHI